MFGNHNYGTSSIDEKERICKRSLKDEMKQAISNQNKYNEVLHHLTEASLVDVHFGNMDHSNEAARMVCSLIGEAYVVREKLQRQIDFYEKEISKEKEKKKGEEDDEEWDRDD